MADHHGGAARIERRAHGVAEAAADGRRRLRRGRDARRAVRGAAEHRRARVRREPCAERRRSSARRAAPRSIGSTTRATGKQIALAGQEPKFVERVLEAVGRPDLVPLCARGPGPHQQPVVECLRHFSRAGLGKRRSIGWRSSTSASRRSTRCSKPCRIRNVAARELAARDEQGPQASRAADSVRGGTGAARAARAAARRAHGRAARGARSRRRGMVTIAHIARSRAA